MKFSLYGHTIVKWLMLFGSVLNAIVAGNSLQQGELAIGLMGVFWMSACFFAFTQACLNQTEVRRRIHMVESGEYARLQTRLQEIHSEVQRVKSRADILLTQLIELNRKMEESKDEAEADRLEKEGWALADIVAEQHFQAFRLVQEGTFIMSVINGENV
jgi:hypothetical protein